MSTKILTQNMHVANLQQLGIYESLGGYKGLAKALNEYQPAEITDIVKRDRVRSGRDIQYHKKTIHIRRCP